MGVENFFKAQSSGEEDLVVECLRSLRNLVAGVESNQDLVLDLILEEKFRFWDFCHHCTTGVRSDLSTVKLRCLVQFLGNLTSASGLERQISHISSLISTLKAVITNTDTKAQLYACMPLLTLLRNSSSLPNDVLPQLANFLPHLLNILIGLEGGEFENDTDFLHLCLQVLLTTSVLLPLLTAEDRVGVAAVILSPDRDTITIQLPPENMMVLAKDFTRHTDKLLTTNLGSVDSLRPGDILSLTQVLSIAAGLQEFREPLQKYPSLVINTVSLLKMVHAASRGGVSGLQLLGKISDTEGEAGTGLEDGPGYGFMAALMRLLTNLVWDHPENKSVVGDLEGVALVLDCTQMDARNPFITQWAVLAIRALTENHKENQAILAGLQRKGVMDGSLMKELGLGN